MIFIDCNFELSTLKQVIEYIQQRAGFSQAEFSLFHGSTLLYEQNDYLEEDEISNYERNAGKTCRELTKWNQLRFLLQDDSEKQITIYLSHTDSAVWNHRMELENDPLNEFEAFMVASNKRVRPAVKPAQPVTADRERIQLESLSDDSGEVEEQAAQQTEKNKIIEYNSVTQGRSR